jgi:hypothetical protein
MPVRKLFVVHTGYKISDHVLYVAAHTPKEARRIAQPHLCGMSIFSIEEKGPVII